jgi:hypothetical protein
LKLEYDGVIMAGAEGRACNKFQVGLDFECGRELQGIERLRDVLVAVAHALRRGGRLAPDEADPKQITTQPRVPHRTTQ